MFDKKRSMMTLGGFKDMDLKKKKSPLKLPYSIECLSKF